LLKFIAKDWRDEVSKLLRLQVLCLAMQMLMGFVEGFEVFTRVLECVYMAYRAFQSLIFVFVGL
jgi:hypothetical protein